MISKLEAILSINPLSECTIRDGVIEWLSPDITQPSDSEIQAEVIRLQTEYDALQYSRSRQEEYPSIQECIHAILDDDLTALQEKRQAVKDKYPKESN